MRALSMLSLPLWAIATAGACRCDVDPLARSRAGLLCDPKEVHLTNIPVAQDTRIVVQLSNPRFVRLTEVRPTLEEGHDPAFRLVDPIPDEVLPGQVEEVVVMVRPRVVSTIAATLTVTADEEARPSTCVVPITVQAIDAGLPDICGYPEQIGFDPIGVNSVARAAVPVCNCGVRDLLIDELKIVSDVDGDQSILITTPVPAGTDVGPGECITLDVVFAPQDLEEHNAELLIRSNDPDEPEVRIPLFGQASACPIACLELVDGAEDIEPFDTVRLDAHCSQPSSDSPDAPAIEGAEWSLEIRPVGSTAILEVTDDLLASEVAVDLAGEYCVRLHVVDTAGVRSCDAATACWDVVPTEDLHIQLVWDHPEADLDLHTTRGPTFAVFNHDTDVYFSNRDPEPVPPWSTNPEENPALDVDDDDGYGPENTNIIHPAPNSQWRLFVHYWNAQTDGDPRTTATLRVFVYGQQVIEVQRTFEEDEQLWHALDIVWPAIQGDPASISQIGVVEPFARPF